jgi:hypothetical protein
MAWSGQVGHAQLAREGIFKPKNGVNWCRDKMKENMRMII